MALMRDAYLVDTNVWMDYYLQWRPRHADARVLVDGCVSKGFGLLVSVTTLSDLFFSMQSAVKAQYRKEQSGQDPDLTPAQALFAREYAWGCVENLVENHTVVGADLGDVWVGQRQRAVHPDFEDDLVIAAAYRAEPEFIITNDEKLLRHSPYAAMDVADAIKLLELPMF